MKGIDVKAMLKSAEDAVNRSIGLLNEISKGKFVATPNWYKDELKSRLREAYKTKRRENFSEGDIKTLCSILIELEGNLRLYFMREYLDGCWREEYAVYLNRFVLMKWGTDEINDVRIFLNAKNALKSYLDECGDLRLALYIHKQKKCKIEKVHEYVNLGVPFTEYYFGEVLKYYYKNREMSMKQMLALPTQRLMEKHHNEDVTRVIVATIVTRYHLSRGRDRADKEKIVSLSEWLLGEARVDNVKWMPTKALNKEDRRKLNEARILIARWKSQREVINIWDQLRHRTNEVDKYRAQFWIEKSEDLSGEEPLYRLVSLTNSTNSLMDKALIMRFGRYTVVEYLNVAGGCAYFYLGWNHTLLWVQREGSRDIQEYTGRRARLPLLRQEVVDNKMLEATGMEEVRIEHRGDWHTRFNYFWDNKVSLNL